jgi:hypothetical protein
MDALWKWTSLSLLAELAFAVAVASPDLPAGSAAEPASMQLQELLATGPTGLGPSARARSLAGRRVRLVGFMARLEEAPRGAFWLASRPLTCDEGGAGTGDLPLDAVRVVVRSAPDREVAWLPGPIEVTGTLQVGREEDALGGTSGFRLLLDRAGEGDPPAPASAPAGKS